MVIYWTIDILEHASIYTQAITLPVEILEHVSTYMQAILTVEILEEGKYLHTINIPIPVLHNQPFEGITLLIYRCL